MVVLSDSRNGKHISTIRLSNLLTSPVLSRALPLRFHRVLAQPGNDCRGPEPWQYGCPDNMTLCGSGYL